MLPSLVEEFADRRSAVEIRGCADAILARNDDAPCGPTRRSSPPARPATACARTPAPRSVTPDGGHIHQHPSMRAGVGGHRGTRRRHHRHPRQSARAEAALARIDELGIERVYCGGDLVGYGPHPNEVCALIAEREIPTIYGNYDYAIARDLDDCGCAYVTAHDRELGQLSVEWTLAHTNQASKDWMRELPFDLRFDARRARRPPRPRLAAQGQRVPLRGQARPASTSASPPPRTPTCSSSGTPTSPGSTSTAACGSSTAARSANQRTATHAARSPSSRHPRRHRGPDRTRRLRRRGRRRPGPRSRPAGEYADKLLIAA